MLAYCLLWKLKMYIGTQPKCKRWWIQISAIKQFSETSLLVVKMCAGFTTDVIWVNTKVCSGTIEPPWAVADTLCALRTHQCYWTSEIWMNLAKLWKPEKYITKQPKCTNPWKQISAIKQLLETLKAEWSHIELFNGWTLFQSFCVFSCVPICIFSFHHKQCASNYNDFFFVILACWWVLKG